MKWPLLAALAVANTAPPLVGCNAERQHECDQFLSALKPLDQAVPSVEVVSRIRDALTAIAFQDEPLREYSKNAVASLAVLSNTLELQADPSAPDGTAAVAKAKLKEVRGERDDVAKYCAP